jgi:excinuclease UvrABC nuclease subunit
MDIKDFSIPQTPGCYLFKDDKEQIIYVGKSKFLPKRVSSYFQKNHKDIKTVKLVTEIKNVDFISTETENEAFILEEDLIKLYMPKFNIKGKDSRTIRSKLVLSDGDWKKIELFYPQEEFSGKVLAEFTSGKIANEVLETIYDIFNLRSCSYDLTDENITKGKFKSCLEWHLGRCSAPCIGLGNKIDYLFSIKLIKDIFAFNFKTSVNHFTRRMKYFSDKLEFEKAQVEKEKIFKVKKIEGLIKPLKVVGQRKRTVEIQSLLNLKFTPTVIDAFDNSHTSGTEAVCGMVRFTTLQPDKSEWRKFIIKSGAGGDDYGSFDEVLMRRFKRLVQEKTNLPNLVIIDGARPQLNVAIYVLKSLDIYDKLDVIAISKDDKHRANLIHLSNGTDVSIKSYNEFAHILNEVHRFSLDFHRKRMSKKMFK